MSFILVLPGSYSVLVMGKKIYDDDKMKDEVQVFKFTTVISMLYMVSNFFYISTQMGSVANILCPYCNCSCCKFITFSSSYRDSPFQGKEKHQHTKTAGYHQLLKLKE